MNVVEILTKARELISDPNKWFQGGYSCDARGNVMFPLESLSCKWCSMGAVCVVEGVRNGAYISKDVSRYLTIAIEKTGFAGTNIALFNDAKETTHEDVMNVFSEAIVIALNEEKQ